MAFEASAYEISNGISGLLFIVLGLLVARVRTGGASNWAFALFAVSFGAGVFVLNLILPGHPIFPTTSLENAAMVSAAFLWAGAAAALVWLAVVVRRQDRAEGVWVVASVVVTVVYVGLAMAPGVGDRSWGNLLFFTCFQALLGVMWGLCFLFAHRFLVSPEKEAAGYALMSAALALYPAFWAAIQFARLVWVVDAREATLGEALLSLGPALFIGVVWSVVVLRSSGARAQMARTVVWLCLGASLGGLLAAPSAVGSEHWGYGATRFVAVALLALAIVRGQAPGIDGTLRFGVSRSTVAAAFVAVFFVVSEGAQLVWGQETPWLGLFAAGGLVFVLAPLQRAADRFAERAVPMAGRGARLDDAAADAYRHGLRAAMRDGKLARREERHLAELARSLGLDSVQALALREEVEAELA